MRPLPGVTVSVLLVLVFAVGCSSDDSSDSSDSATTAAPTLETTTTIATTSTTIERDAGPVAADAAQIRITYTGDGTSYVGHREIIEGTVAITFVNDSHSGATVGFYWYETGSAGLAEELEFLAEGEKGVPIGLPAEGYVEVELEGSGDLVPGSHIWTVDLEPGTYLFDVGPPDFRATGLWRAAVIEVVGA